jgi:hypothetical protein
MPSILRFADSPCGAAWGHLGFRGERIRGGARRTGRRSRLAVCTRGALDESGWRVLAEGAWPIFCHPVGTP